MKLPEGTRFQVLAPVVRGRKGTHAKEFEAAARSGFARVRVDGNLYDLDEEITLDKNRKHTVEIVVDRLVIRPDIRTRLADSLETAIELTGSLVTIDVVGGSEMQFSQSYACPEHGVSVEELTPRMFSFNNPLGACALAGTTMPIDRHFTSQLLGFAAPCENAMDAVSDRDYSLEFLSDASISMMHLSRWAEEFAWWNSSEFSYIAIDDSFCTGSSIMPQKKNPDMAELIRGKVGRVYGDLMQLLTVMKGTPLAYNKDFQEDKESLFDAVDTWKASIDIFTKMLDKTEFRMDQIEKQLGKGFLNATDVAEHLAKQGIPFREAHSIVGRMVKACEGKGCDLEDLTQEDLQAIDSRVTKESLGDISIPSCVDARVSFGGTAPSEVRRQIAVGRAWLDSLAEQ